jgi:hypothetical protein
MAAEAITPNGYLVHLADGGVATLTINHQPLILRHMCAGLQRSSAITSLGLGTLWLFPLSV